MMYNRNVTEAINVVMARWHRHLRVQCRHLPSYGIWQHCISARFAHRTELTVVVLGQRDNL
ncbi:hypothetical protein T01_13877 [Trichinella spiralis]|uniref:Uncharacterized protein n=1 Tax=Trichinella spiralis TaxID=6334 RepID=A0A0V1AVH7_TRISP|nr:hypothetical protein T01_10812 [Trichinella spiralis]KRY36308.1 hypothetical protein T01_13877 [Trichinella spiralis]